MGAKKMTTAFLTKSPIFKKAERRFKKMPKKYAYEVKLCCFVLRKLGVSVKKIVEIFHGKPNKTAVRRFYKELESKFNSGIQVSVQPQMEQVPQVLVARH